VELTGDNINDAQPGFTETNQPSVNLVLDSAGSDIFADLTRANRRQAHGHGVKRPRQIRSGDRAGYQ
jgi:preprotein translocase subunit SecD